MFRVLVILLAGLFGAAMGWIFGAGIVGMFFHGTARTAMTNAEVTAAEPWMTIAGLLGAVIGAYLAGNATAEWFDRWIRWP